MKRLFVLTVLATTIIFSSGCNKKTATTKKKDYLVYAQLSEGKTLDPQDTTDSYSQVVTTQLYDRLVEINEMTGKIEPGLADSWKFLDDKTLLLNLNKKAKFHNGTDFTAKDVKFSIERAQKMPKISHLYSNISLIELIDDDTIKIHTKKPFAPLLNHLSHKSAAIMSENYFKEKNNAYFETPIGTGPYKYSEWIFGDRITLLKNKEYFKGEPSINKIIIKAIPEENSKIIGLETGEIDISSGIQTVGRTTIIESDKLTFKEHPSTSTSYIGFNTQKGSLKDKNIRRAIVMGIDRKAIIDALLVGNTQIANNFLAPQIFGYSEKTKVLPYNPEKAKQLLNGKKYKFIYATSNSQLNSQIAEIVQAQLKDIGIDIEIQILEWGAFLSATANGQFDMFSMGWGPSTYDGDYGVYPNFHSSQLGTSGNRSQYLNPHLDSLLEQARKEMNIEKRKKLYEEISTIINEDAPVIPLYYSNTTVGVTNDLNGVEATSYPIFYKYNYKN